MIGKCSVCGFEAASEFIVGGKCCACRLPVGKEISCGWTGERVPRLVEMVPCACGCGTMFNKWDNRNRARKYCDRRHQYKDVQREFLRRMAISRAQCAS